MGIPEGWSSVPITEILHADQIRDLEREHKAGKLTQARIKEIINRKTDKMEGKVLPQFLMYSLMNQFGVYS